jgi:hypothetical protein
MKRKVIPYSAPHAASVSASNSTNESIANGFSMEAPQTLTNAKSLPSTEATSATRGGWLSMLLGGDDGCLLVDVGGYDGDLKSVEPDVPENSHNPDIRKSSDHENHPFIFGVSPGTILSDRVPKRSVDIEANFDLTILARLDCIQTARETEQTPLRTAVGDFIAAQRYHIFPAHTLAPPSHMHMDFNNVKEHFSPSSEFWKPGIDPDSCSRTKDFVGLVKQRKLQWQKALHSILGGFLVDVDGSSAVERFYIIPQLHDEQLKTTDAGRSGIGENLNSLLSMYEKTLPVSAMFYRAKGLSGGKCREPFVIASGVTPSMIKRLSELGVRAPKQITDCHTQALQHLHHLNRLSVSGSTELNRSGKILLLCGAFEIRIFAQVVNECVFACNNRTKFLVNVPSIVCSNSDIRSLDMNGFRFSTPRDFEVSRVSCHQSFQSSPHKMGPTPHKIQLRGFFTATALGTLTRLLLLLADVTTAPEMNATAQKCYRRLVDEAYLVSPLLFKQTLSHRPGPKSPSSSVVETAQPVVVGTVAAEVKTAMKVVSVRSTVQQLWLTSSISGVSLTRPQQGNLRRVNKLFNSAGCVVPPQKLAYETEYAGSTGDTAELPSSMNVERYTEACDSLQFPPTEESADCVDESVSSTQFYVGTAKSTDNGDNINLERIDDGNDLRIMEWLQSRKEAAAGVANKEPYFAMKCSSITRLAVCSYGMEAARVMIRYAGLESSTEKLVVKEPNSSSDTCLESERQPNVSTDRQLEITKVTINSGSHISNLDSLAKNGTANGESVVPTDSIVAIAWRHAYRKAAVETVHEVRGVNSAFSQDVYRIFMDPLVATAELSAIQQEPKHSSFHIRR